MHHLDSADIAKFFRAFREEHTPKSKRHHMVALTLFFSGCRIGQCLDLKGTDVISLNGRYVILIGAAKHGQNGVRAIQTSKDPAFDMTPLIEMAAQMGEHKLFSSLDRHYFDKVMKRIGAKAGIHESYCHAHMFRHSAAMTVFDRTQRIGAVSQFLLHKSAGSAYIYLAENDGQRAQAAMDSLHLS